ncbi:hypothetical protein AAC387_Pa01g1703 [Persea americana]
MLKKKKLPPRLNRRRNGRRRAPAPSLPEPNCTLSPTHMSLLSRDEPAARSSPQNGKSPKSLPFVAHTTNLVISCLGSSISLGILSLTRRRISLLSRSLSQLLSRRSKEERKVLHRLFLISLARSQRSLCKASV